ncbi:hypothetical protein GLYMA_02G247500v4 [Glycine max]|uniref:Uncharacterized protein n=1 Tax=Glycine max TaxID=3847 RepID=K7KAL3_SOYBN|nr:hypothetical protein GYH30_005112 [Glycine max]KRH73030.1 hypothetical protein GLYMA_02G247500v4 [Glycine max]
MLVWSFNLVGQFVKFFDSVGFTILPLHHLLEGSPSFEICASTQKIDINMIRVIIFDSSYGNFCNIFSMNNFYFFLRTFYGGRA